MALDGSIPSQLGQLSNLKVLNLGSNALTGAVPSEIFSMNSLETLCALPPTPLVVHCCMPETPSSPLRFKKPVSPPPAVADPAPKPTAGY
jgi:hypothetical protein